MSRLPSQHEDWLSSKECTFVHLTHIESLNSDLPILTMFYQSASRSNPMLGLSQIDKTKLLWRLPLKLDFTDCSVWTITAGVSCWRKTFLKNSVLAFASNCLPGMRLHRKEQGTILCTTGKRRGVMESLGHHLSLAYCSFVSTKESWWSLWWQLFSSSMRRVRPDYL